MIPDDRRAPFDPIVYINDTGRQLRPIGMESGLLEQLVLAGRMVIAADVRGIGDTEPDRRPRDEGNPFRNLFSVETGLAYLAWKIGRDLLGMRVLDVIRTVDYAASRPDVNARNVSLIGSGMGATWALYAAALDERIASTVCDGGLLAYKMIAEADRFSHHASVFALDVLRHFDLPQVAAAIAPRRLALLAPVDHIKRAVPAPLARTACEFAQQTYAAAGAEARFAILERDRTRDLPAQYLAALGA